MREFWDRFIGGQGLVEERKNQKLIQAKPGVVAASIKGTAELTAQLELAGLVARALSCEAQTRERSHDTVDHVLQLGSHELTVTERSTANRATEQTWYTVSKYNIDIGQQIMEARWSRAGGMVLKIATRELERQAITGDSIKPKPVASMFSAEEFDMPGTAPGGFVFPDRDGVRVAAPWDAHLEKAQSIAKALVNEVCPSSIDKQQHQLEPAHIRPGETNEL